MTIWRNGEFVGTAGAVAGDDRGVLLGDGLFETLAMVDSRPLRLAKHLDRLRMGASALRIPVPLDGQQAVQAITELCRLHKMTEGSARITVLRGPGPRGVLPPREPTPVVLIAVHEGTVGDTRPMTAVVASSTRRNDRSPLSGIKTTNYGDAILARREANAAGADDAIMLNTRDTVAEATAANVFCVIDGAVVTPPVADGALPGIMRDAVMMDVDALARTISTEDLQRAEEIFLTSSLSVRPVVKLDGAPVGTGQPGPVAARLADLPRRAD